MSTNLENWLTHAVHAARLGAEQLEFWRSRFTVREKARADLVTEGDQASQLAVIGYLQEQFLDHAFIGEEDPASKDIRELPSDAPPTWIIDPLDGTVNYAHDVPAYCVSIGLMAAGQLQVGVIFDPRMNELFTATLGGGAFLNGSPMSVSTISKLEFGLVSTGFPPNPDAQARIFPCWQEMSLSSQAIRRTGSTALNLAYVAAGRFDGYYALDNWAWDVAAGILLVTEAGGAVSSATGSPVNPFRPDILATNGHLQAEMLAIMAKYYQ